MRLFLSILFFFICTSLSATNYYVKALGNNNLSGTSINNAWATLAKVNSFTGFLVGDTVFLEGGSTFVGPLIPPRNGVAGRPFVFTSYGTGEATITALTTLTGWSNLGSNIWDCSAPTLKNTVNILTINAVPQRLGRTPNSTFYTYTNPTSTSIRTTALGAAPSSYVGGEVVMRCNPYIMQRATITAQSTTSGSTTLTYTRTAQGMDNGNAQGLQTGSSNYGFFLQRFAASLDQQGEWYYNPTTDRMRIYSTINPSTLTIKASYIDTLIVLGSRSYITLDNLAIEGAGIYAVYGNVSTTGNLVVKNCTFNNNTRAVQFWNCFASVIRNNTINNSFNVGILFINRQQKQQTIDTNIVTNTGKLLGNGIFPTNENLNGIVQETDSTRANNFVYIRRNIVRSTGYMAIKFQGTNVRVSKNISDSFCINIDDGGGIYTFVENRFLINWNYSNRVVDSNFISNAIGAPAGTNRTYPDAIGYYMDDQVNYVTGYHNSISNTPGYGAQFNNPRYMTFYDNTIYNSHYTLNIKHKLYGPLNDNRITRNILYQKDNTQFNLQHESANLSQPPPPRTITQSMRNMAYIDSNWITNLKTGGYDYYYSSTGGSFTFPSPMTLSNWRSSILHDIVSVLPPTVVTNTNTTFYDNPTDTVRIISFNGLSKVDPKGVVYNNIATVPQWSSLILIDNGTATPVNTYPIANAGADQTITTPTSTVTLNGSASYDPDGSIIMYSWVKLSGPSGDTIASPSAAITNVRALIAGIYQYQLTVTDNNSATATSITRVTVNVPPNTAPTASAGIDQSITLPASTTTLVGSGNDPDGSISSYAWVKVSGPSGGTITSPSSASTGITALQQGTYAFQLNVTDNGGLTGSDIMNVVVNPANVAPTADAGSDQTTTLPANSVTLTGTGTDPDGTIASYLWAKISGPTGGAIATPTTASTDITSLQEGTYVYQLTVTDNLGLTGIDFVQVLVSPVVPPENLPPTASAGEDQVITLPTATTTLVGMGVDPEGGAVTFAWTKISGPTGGTITSSTSATTGITALQQGTYAYQLTVTDNLGLTTSSFVQVLVNPAIPPANEPPTADAGPDTTITLPQTTAALYGSGTDTDGTIVSYAWVKISGPTGGNITIPSSATTGITSLEEGTYAYRLTVTDNNGATGFGFVQVIVNPAVIAPNGPPTANAGSDTTIVLPTSSATLNGIGSDTDGVIIAYFWRQLSGPTTATISSTTTPSTVVGSMIAGDYIFQLRVTDDRGDTATDAIQVTVNPANLLPIVEAGANQIITLPIDTITITATASDPDGTINTISWVKVSGPTGGAIASPSALSTLISGMVEGVYIYRIKVVDNRGDTAIASVQITVNPEPIITKPIANVGEDQIIYLPSTTATLSGSGTNGTGTIISHAWSLFSGPSGGDIATPQNYTTTVINLVEGTYIYKLTVTDNNGLVGTGLVQIVVRPIPELRSILLRGYKQ